MTNTEIQNLAIAEAERSRELEKKVTWSLMLGAIGDGLGMPWESLKRNEILARTGGEGVKRFVEPANIRTDSSWTIGQITDDTQLALAVAHSLAACKGWNPFDCMKRHVAAMHESTMGWGKSTKSAVAAFEDNLKRNPNFTLDLSRPPMAVPGQGGGNGPEMKVAPLALFTAIEYGQNPAVLSQRVCELSFLTHSDPQAALGAYSGALLVSRGLERPIHTPVEGLVYLQYIIEELEKLEAQLASRGMVIDKDKTLSKIFTRLTDVIGDLDAICNLADNDSAPFLGRTTAILTTALFIRNAGNAANGMLEAINVGGDTDTHASILGNIFGAHDAGEKLPIDWQEFMRVHPLIYQPVQTASRELFMAAQEAKMRLAP